MTRLYFLALLAVLSESSVRAQTFDDVPTDYWAYNFIEALAASGITAGCGNNNYCPEDAVNRAQMAVFLERGMKGSDYVPPAASGKVFVDVGAGDFAANFIEQLYADAITVGCGNNNYCPDAQVSRAQMAVFLLRATHGSSYSPPAAIGIFNDVELSYWAVNWIEALAAEGITAGCGSGKYCPEDSVSRAQMAVFLVRSFITRPTDTTSPVITLTGDNPQFVIVGGTYVELGATATDNVDGDLTESIEIDSSAVDVSNRGDYEVTYDVTDAAGNAATTVTRTVTVQAQYAEASIVGSIAPLGNSNGFEIRPEHAAIADLNGDGFDDAVVHLIRNIDPLIAPGPTTRTVILLNNGAGELVPGNSSLQPLNGVAGATPIIDGDAPAYFWVRQILIEDFNLDGQLDIFFENHGLEPGGDPELFPGEQNGLWLSRPDGMLIDVSATHLPQFSDFSHGSSVADVDGDLDLDIWVNNLGANDVPAYLMLNDGSGRFTAAADLGYGGPDDNGPKLGPNGRLPAVIGGGNLPFWSAFADVDGDSDKDLYLGYLGFDDGMTIDNRAVLLLNNGSGVFEMAPADAVPAPLWNSMGLVEDQLVHDVNNDGREDLVMTVTENGPSPTGQEIQFLINTGAGGFNDQSSTRFPPQSNQKFFVETWFADLDGDSDDDLLTGTFEQREMYENNGSGVFSLVDPSKFMFDWWFIPIDLDGDGKGTDFLHVMGDNGGELSFHVTKRNP